MMTNLLVIRERLRKIYAQYTLYITPMIKVLSTMIALVIISFNVGYMDLLKNPLVIIIISLLAAFLPQSLIVLVLALVVVGHLYALSIEMAAAALAVFVLLFLLFFRFTPKQGIIVVLVPILFFIKIPYVVPIVLGLVATPFAIVSVAFGVAIYYMLSYVGLNIAYINGIADESGLQKIITLLKGVFANKAMWITALAFAVVLVLVYVLRKLSIDYAWYIAIAAGGVVSIVMMLIGYLKLGVADYVSIPAIIIGSIVSIGLAFAVQFFVLMVDYTRTEYTQFEDDEYYYYVKAVPKITITAPEVNVKRINAQKVTRQRRTMEADIDEEYEQQ